MRHLLRLARNRRGGRELPRQHRRNSSPHDDRYGATLAFVADDLNIEVFSSRRSQFDYGRDDAKLSGKNAIVVTDLWHPLSPAITGHYVTVDGLGGHDVIRFGRVIAHDDFYLAKSDRP
jgi:hypothetical protein